MINLSLWIHETICTKLNETRSKKYNIWTSLNAWIHEYYNFKKFVIQRWRKMLTSLIHNLCSKLSCSENVHQGTWQIKKSLCSISSARSYLRGGTLLKGLRVAGFTPKGPGRDERKDERLILLFRPAEQRWTRRSRFEKRIDVQFSSFCTIRRSRYRLPRNCGLRWRLIIINLLILICVGLAERNRIWNFLVLEKNLSNAK